MMLRNIIQTGKKVINPKNSRSFQCSVVHKGSQDWHQDLKKDGNTNSDEYWTTEIEEEDAFERAFRVLGKQWRDIKNRALFWKKPDKGIWSEWHGGSDSFPSHIDVLIIGGGIMGSSIAYWLKRMGGEHFSVVVIDRETLDKKASSMLLSGSFLRQQFSLEENIEMAQYATEFFHNVNYYLGVHGDPPIDLQYRPHGSLILAHTDEEAVKLAQNARLLSNNGVRVSLLSAEQIKNRFPWINTDGIVVGSLGLEGEGSFNPWELLKAYRKKGYELGVEYVTSELKGFVIKKPFGAVVTSPVERDLYNQLNHAVVRTPYDEKKVIQFGVCVIAAGPESGEIATKMKIGKTCGVRSVALPIEKRKRYLYGIQAPNGPGLNTPLIIDGQNFYFRRETLANHYIVGRPLREDDEESFDTVTGPNDKFFYDKIHPQLTNRIPVFKEIEKFDTSWAGFVDHNSFDGNGVVGFHPFYTNVFFATGFGDFAPQMSPAVGRATCEFLRNGFSRSIPLERLTFDRFLSNEAMAAAVL